MFEIRKIAIIYDARADRLRLVFSNAGAATQAFELTRKLAGQLLHALCTWLEDGIPETAGHDKLAAALEARHVEAISAVARRREEARGQPDETTSPSTAEPQPEVPAERLPDESDLPRLLTRVALSRRKSVLVLQFFAGSDVVEARGTFGQPAVHTIVHRLCRVIVNAGWDAGLPVPSWTRIGTEDAPQAKAILH